MCLLRDLENQLEKLERERMQCVSDNNVDGLSNDCNIVSVL